MTFTETWPTEREQSTNLHMDGFRSPHADWGTEVTTRVSPHINKRCRELICAPDVQLLSVSLPPFYLPRDFPQLFITAVYIHLRANAAPDHETIYDVVQINQFLLMD